MRACKLIAFELTQQLVMHRDVTATCRKAGEQRGAAEYFLRLPALRSSPGQL